MIVVGIDPHKKSHTAVAIDAVTAAQLSEMTVPASKEGLGRLLSWARRLGAGRVFAVEDCRHVSGALERALLPRGERVVRVPPKMMSKARSSARTYGKSDPIDAACVARAALREPGLPEARLHGVEHDVRLLADHRDDLVCERKRIQKRLRWNCHDLEVALELPPWVLDRYVWLDRLQEALSALPPTTRRRIAEEQLQRCRELTGQVRALEREIAGLVRESAPALLAIPGCSAICAAHLMGQTAGASRFTSESAFAMHIGTAPLPVSSGASSRHRLNRYGNRKLNAAVHMMAITQIRTYQPARAYVARKQAEGKGKREALRCLKRYIARSVFGILKEIDQAGTGQVINVTFRTDMLPVPASA